MFSQLGSVGFMMIILCVFMLFFSLVSIKYGLETTPVLVNHWNNYSCSICNKHTWKIPHTHTLTNAHQQFSHTRKCINLVKRIPSHEPRETFVLHTNSLPSMLLSPPPLSSLPPFVDTCKKVKRVSNPKLMCIHTQMRSETAENRRPNTQHTSQPSTLNTQLTVCQHVFENRIRTQ